MLLLLCDYLEEFALVPLSSAPQMNLFTWVHKTYKAEAKRLDTSFRLNIICRWKLEGMHLSVNPIIHLWNPLCIGWRAKIISNEEIPIIKLVYMCTRMCSEHWHLTSQLWYGFGCLESEVIAAFPIYNVYQQITNNLNHHLLQNALIQQIANFFQTMHTVCSLRSSPYIGFGAWKKLFHHSRCHKRLQCSPCLQTWIIGISNTQKTNS